MKRIFLGYMKISLYLCQMNLYTMDRLLNFFTLIFTLLVCISCNNDEMLKVMDRIKDTGNSDPITALHMLDSIQGKVDEANEYIKMKSMLLTLRLKDKAYILPMSDDTVKKVVPYFEEKGTDAEKQEAYYYAGSVYRDLDDAPKALDFFLKSEDTANKSAQKCDSLLLRNTYSNMVQIFFSFQDYHSSLEMAKKEYSISRRIGDVTINSLSHLADSYLRVDSSQQTGSIAKIMEKYTDKHSAVDTYGLLAIYSYIRNRQKAKETYNAIRGNSIEPDAMGYNALAEYYLLNDNTDSAIVCYERIIEGDYDITYTYDAARFLFDLYQKKGDTAKSIKYSKLFMRYSDSLDFGQRQELLATVNNQFQYYKNKAEDDRIQKENSDYRNRANLLVAMVLLLTTGSIAIYYYNKSRYLNKIAIISNSLSLTKAKQEELERDAVKIEQSLVSTKETLNNKENELMAVNSKLLDIKNELEIKEKKLADTTEDNKKLASLVHKADLEENADDIISTLENGSKGRYDLSKEDWNRIYKAIDLTHPNLMEKMIHNLGHISEERKQVGYLLSIGLSNPQIQKLTGVPSSTLWRWVKGMDWINSEE